MRLASRRSSILRILYPMRIKELIAELQACDPEAEIRWYHLENHILTGMELETIITDAWDNRPTVEITVKPEGSGCGGVQCYEVENVGICTGLAWAEEQAASFTDKAPVPLAKTKLWKPQPFN